MGFSRNTQDPALAVLARALGDIEKPGLGFSQLTFRDFLSNGLLRDHSGPYYVHNS